MKPVSKKLLISLLTRVVVVIIAAKALALAILWFLPSEGVSLNKLPSVQPEYRRYSLSTMLDKKAATANTGGATEAYGTIDDLLLKGLYGTEHDGFVIVAMKSSPDATDVIAVGESFRGYKLRSIHPQHALFTFKGNSYKVAIESPKALPASTMVTEETFDDAPRAVTRTQISEYTSDFDRIWNDIGIREVKKAGKITGFEVVRIRAGTPLAEMGLKKGDIITQANNKVLDSYAAAMEVYKKVDEIKALELTILRNNQEKELVYEIY